jgi:hypothetical protein
MGSVAEHVVRSAACPVLATHHPREEVRRATEREGDSALTTGPDALPAEGPA